MKKEPQFYWHIHHDILLEPLTEPIENRIKFIKENKPKDEIKLRLKLLKPVKGKLPLERDEVRQKYDEARQKCDEVRQKYDEVRQKYDEARQKCDEAWQKCDEAWQKYDEARQKYNEARQKCNEAWQKYDEVRQKYKSQIEVLHKKECPNCPWTGSSIFPKK